MASEARPARAARFSPQRWSLQTRLLVAISAAVAVVIVAIGVSTAVMMRGVIQYNLDARVRDAASQISIHPQGLDPNEGTAVDTLGENAVEPGLLLVMQAPAGSISAAYMGSGSAPVALPDDTAAALFSSAVRGYSTVSVPQIGTYRLVSFSAGGYSGVIGLPTSSTQAIIGKLILTILVATAVGLLLVGGLITVIIRLGMRPLRKVEKTALRVAAIPMDDGATRIPDRVEVARSDENTEIGRVAIAFNQLLDHVERSLVSRDQKEEQMRAFVADASHELRTPLASIRGYSELSLRDDSLAAMPKQAFERIHSQSLRMTSLVEDLLLLARLDEKQEILHAPVDLTGIVRDAVADACAASPDHIWAVDAPDEPVLVTGDAQRLTQVVTNLLANARTHTPTGTEITAAVQTEGEAVVMTVHDTGPGIPADLVDRIFDRFTRGDSSRARSTGGAGLGLAIATAITRAHDGTITVTSAPGDTTFALTLKGAPATVPSAAVPSAAVPSGEVPSGALSAGH